MGGERECDRAKVESEAKQEMLIRSSDQPQQLYPVMYLYFIEYIQLPALLHSSSHTVTAATHSNQSRRPQAAKVSACALFCSRWPSNSSSRGARQGRGAFAASDHSANHAPAFSLAFSRVWLVGGCTHAHHPPCIKGTYITVTAFMLKLCFAHHKLVWFFSFLFFFWRGTPNHASCSSPDAATTFSSNFFVP